MPRQYRIEIVDINNRKRRSRRNLRIMIIDDDEDTTNLFKIFLEYNGYNIDAYTNPIDVLNNYRKNSHDLIILDIKMPKMDGITLYQKIKEIDNNVIICLTTADKNFIKELEKGVIDIEKIVMYKPILLRDLRNRIDTLLVEHEYDDGDNNENVRIDNS